ncbi:bi-domain-containing oxidoreductase [Hahella ganghwensis]|uniref:bi-domain-containing oxidoreductase n=1 Tax=Hahella ganghwensis TaxID=286420 RepID=UPI0003757C3C|nr:bi-domain-containing oxidoreductase [Hahella ganghwensis]
MKQVAQVFKAGSINIYDVPVPTLTDKFVLVRNANSVISAGTEKTKVDMGKKSLLQKAKARPDLVRQVIKKLQTEGLGKTLQTVNSRLNSPSPLGYSSAGEVVAVGGLVKGLRPGDRVACGGAGYANHAEFVAVPKNLIAKVPDNVIYEEAAFTTLGAIALQGVRLAEPRLGETFLVIGLGLLGQIAVQLLRANGCKVIGTDLDPSLVSLAEKYGAVGVHPGGDAVATCHELTGSYGVDGVLICAGTSSNQPVELSGQITREKGRVVVIGAVRMDIPREEYFKKEISVVISRSYGPGRYDPEYEEGGEDYPYGYVRFTEQRNMETFLSLVSQGSLDISGLITHRFKFENANDAYELIEGDKKEPYLGIVLQYGSISPSPVSEHRITINPEPIVSGSLGISFFGAGNYATSSLLPPLRGMEGVEFTGLATASGRTAQAVAKQFGFRFCSNELNELFTEETDMLMVTSRHDTHAKLVVKALEAGKHVYVEKPLAMSVKELAAIHYAYTKRGDRQIMVGFNRRFSALTTAAIEHFAEVHSPKIVSIRINAGVIPQDHWIQDPKVGGGRWIGEGCHFVDLASALIGKEPVSIYAIGMCKPSKSTLLNDNVSVSVAYEDGSIANIVYAADGSKAMPKERIEMFGGGRSAVIDDFRVLTLYESATTSKRKKLVSQDKGQKSMLALWVKAVKDGDACLAYRSLMANSLATILAVESMTINQPLRVDLSLLEA